ncbi:MAG: permease prefix domain 1-containing protein, partial [Bryobacteraceae bacterium]
MLADLWFRLRSFLRRKDLERELEEELRHHLEQQAAKHVRCGLAPEEAYRRARIELGGMEQIREECRSVRGVAFLQDLLQDVKYAGRGFRRSPGFMLTVVGTIALGLGLNTTFFTIFNAYVLKPAAVRDPYRLFEVTWENRAGQGHWFSWSEFKDLAKKKAVFDQVIGSEFLFARVEGHPMLGEMVGGNYFGVLNVGAAQGRILVPGDVAKIGSVPVVVLSYSAWQDKFGGDSRVIGKKVLFHGYPLEIVGVAQKGFNGLGTPREFWIPLTMSSQLQQGP